MRGLCYVFIVWAFTGYYAELATLYDVTSAGVAQACELVGQGYSLLVDLDEYVPLDAESCVGLGGELYRIASFDIVADSQHLDAARWLAWTDVINAGAWILICLLLEIEVRLQLRGALTDRLVGINKFVKFILYGVLFAAAAYWGVAGDFSISGMQPCGCLPLFSSSSMSSSGNGRPNRKPRQRCKDV